MVVVSTRGADKGSSVNLLVTRARLPPRAPFAPPSRKSGEAKLSIKALAEESERSAYQAYRQQVKTAARFTFADLLAKKDQKLK